ncbi:MAG: PKD domain-containing protein, partial [Flavobacteriales bacterium]|nr:PKD domain-containing protein [Flavobacteriales bacterium]
RVSYTGDIINNIFGGNPNVYWGLTAATGGANNLQQFCNALNPAFIITSPIQCVGSPVDFESASAVATGQITDFQWDFGDGTTGSGGQVTHTYTMSGDYTVDLTISSEGCTETSSTTITINLLPDANLGADLAICEGSSVQITQVTPTVGGNFLWTPASGLDDTSIASPTATPTSTTDYTLNVIDANGCTDSDELTLTVNPLPTADAGTDQAICDGDNTLMDGSGGTSYSWNPATDLTDATSPTTVATPTATTTYTLTATDANGCVDTDDMTLTVNPLPVVIVGADDSMCDEETVQLSGSGVPNYLWNPATGLDDATVANPIFSGSATTTFTLTGTDANGCSETDDVTITVFPLPVADFTAPADVCLGNPTIFTDNSTGNTISYQWNFGDASALNTDINPTYTYATAATFNVALLVTDANGCQDNTSETATVLPLPSAAMNVLDGPDFCENDLIKFENQSTGGTDIFWNFGDNNFLPWLPNTTSTLSNPEFAYSNFAFGPYTVSLSTTDAAGCYDETTQIIVIHDNPTADFTFDIACEGDLTNFTDASTLQDFSVVTSWQWDMADASGMLTSQDPSYGYVVADIYPVELIVETENGCSDTLVQNVWTNPTPVVALAGIDTCLEDETAFSNNSSPQDNTIISWEWDLGDGTTASDVSTAHTYSNAGQFTVSLTATSDSGCVASATTSVEVFPNPEPAFDIIDPEGCTPLTVLFVNKSTIATGFNTGFEWNLGNGESAEGENATTIYPDSGYFDVTLSVTSSEGCNTVLSVDDAVRANITPEAAFSVNKNVFSLLDARLQITDLSLHTLEWDWTFGDGASSQVQNPEHRYDEVGTYNIMLTAINGDCEDTQVRQIKVEPIFTFYIPSAFTPNADYKNETFYGEGEGFTEYNMRISDRWGELLFESNTQKNGWDGSYLGKPVEAGIYVYEFYVLDINSESHTYSGSLTLFR